MEKINKKEDFMSEIYFNGDILTMEKEEYPEAIFIKDGEIEKIGKYSEIIKQKQKDTVMIDLQGKTLMPAFIDAHSHITALAQTLTLVPLNDCKSIEEIIQKLTAKKKQIEKGKWIIGFGYDHNFLQEKKHPNKKDLDQVSKQNPILISHASGHMGVVNSLALEKMGIDETTSNPEGGKIRKNRK